MKSCLRQSGNLLPPVDHIGIRKKKVSFAEAATRGFLCKKSVLKKFHKIHRTAPVPESLF